MSIEIHRVLSEEWRKLEKFSISIIAKYVALAFIVEAYHELTLARTLSQVEKLSIHGKATSRSTLRRIPKGLWCASAGAGLWATVGAYIQLIPDLSRKLMFGLDTAQTCFFKFFDSCCLFGIPVVEDSVTLGKSYGTRSLTRRRQTAGGYTSRFQWEPVLPPCSWNNDQTGEITCIGQWSHASWTHFLHHVRFLLDPPATV